MSLCFHAAPAPGEWLNDPNGLVRIDDKWVLLAQHRTDAPEFSETNWARWTSSDLLDWTFNGPVIASTNGREAFSGSVVLTASGLEAFHTAHVAGHEHQERRISTDAGLTWQAMPLEMPDAAQGFNVRDPAVFGNDGDWWMLLAKPCPWAGWETAPPSKIAILRSPDRQHWTETGTIGPWDPVGVMWEVPTLIREADADLLLISSIDRREGGAECTVRAWSGHLNASGFEVAAKWPADGHRVDHGPDFYAAIPGTGATPQPVVGWLASWATARTLAWPGFAGGPITLPRRVSVSDTKLLNEAWPTLAAAFTEPVTDVPLAGRGTVEIGGAANFTLTITCDMSEAHVVATAANLTVLRTIPAWHCSYPAALTPAPARTLTLFIDGPATELFIDPDGIAISLGLPGTGPRHIVLSANGAVRTFAWHCRRAAP